MNSNFGKKDIKTIIGIAFACIAFYLCLKNISVVIDGAGYIIGIFSPFIVGAATAFIINVPMVRIEQKLFGKATRMKKSRRPVSLLITLALVIGVIVVVMSIIIPQIGQTMISVAEKMPHAYKAFQNWLEENMGYFSYIQQQIDSVSISWDEIINRLSTWIQSFAKGMIGGSIEVVGSIVGAVFNFFIGFIFAVYLLLAKEKLGSQFKQAMYACLGEKLTDRVLYVCHISNTTFASFISGQCLDACILGFMFFVAMTLLRMPYAMLISVFIAFTALIPIVGSTIGCVMGALLIVMENPMQALIFLIMFLILQQVEGNLIYPQVVGNSVGLPSIWVLVAITVGAKLMGVMGMIVFIPLCSVIYSLFRLFVKGKLEREGIDPQKWAVANDAYVSSVSASHDQEETSLP